MNTRHGTKRFPVPRLAPRHVVHGAERVVAEWKRASLLDEYQSGKKALRKPVSPPSYDFSVATLLFISSKILLSGRTSITPALKRSGGNTS
eukprot:CAMPEP_0173398128 /NCGR_PEP_ID=MMETSP1356-20130122/40575_1 /TAXON_ID=77927 ORGANISM="Hemiselmis virescens, Strain PCC157" /NCGR_SAMPLE_ID=MMETSP1356 /ASSEMBLY_ACC=CAM_ASM_000847 /LENGTH=90 /DNA_ID=CAMNT_0014357553 /DNA_START=79 /DNA_END=349 /DNA_ORIENTATION=+